MIEDIEIEEILSSVKQKLEEHFKGSYDDIFGIIAMKLGKQHPYKLKIIKDIEHIVKKHTANEDIIFYIPNEIDTILNSLIEGMYFSNIYKKLNNKDMIDLMFKTIENYIKESEYILNILSKDEFTV